MNDCRLCRRGEVIILFDFGMQPICSRFLTESSDPEYKHPLTFGQCESCGLVQILEPIPPAELLPRYSWISYNEPEGHLDHLVGIIADLDGLTSESSICGISSKDDSTLSRLQELGFEHTYRIDPEEDLHIDAPCSGVETIQDRLIPETANRITQRYGPADVIIARHILEHSHDIYNFIGGIKQLLNPTGYIVFEVPDNQMLLEKFDYSCLWEEHIFYFTPVTFNFILDFFGLSIIFFENYAYPRENSLVGITRLKNGEAKHFTDRKILNGEKQRVRAYFEKLPQFKGKLHKYLSQFRVNNGKIAMFGAGHATVTFTNLMEINDYIDFVADDDRNKHGLYMPGSRLPIYGSSMLAEEYVRLCLLSINPGREDVTINKNLTFTERGGVFSSIYPSSRIALRL